MGEGEGNVLGPLQNQMQWNVVNRLVEDAKASDARVVMGGDPDPSQPGYIVRRNWLPGFVFSRSWFNWSHFTLH